MYETFEHTADLGLRVQAPNTAELFADAARGLCSIMVANFAAVRPVQEVQIHLQGDNIEELWHDWLSELLFMFHGRRLVLAEFKVDIRLPEICDEEDDAVAAMELSSPTILNATARGEPIDPGRHEITVEVKAITWHQLKVERCPNGWLGEVILDI